MLVASDNLDRAATMTIRPQGMARGIAPKLYALARADTVEPVSLVVARALLDQRGKHIGILTGAAVPGFLPNGENDGPLGAIVLGQALKLLGCRVSFITEAEIVGVLNRLMAHYDGGFEWIELDKTSPDDNATVAPEIDALVAIEKLGSNAKHVMHGATGISREGTRAHPDGLVNRLNTAGQLTISIGDGGNEIGFGKYYDQVRAIIPMGVTCQCPCQSGIVPITATQLLYPVAVSNWGGYAVAAALAALTNRPELCHTAEQERKLIDIAVESDCRDGGTGTARAYVDSVPASASAAIVEIMRAIAVAANQNVSRAF